jgi:succinate-acetate transporter protein
MGYSWGICLSESTENLYRVKIALQLSFILWVMFGIFMFYATFEEQSRMLGTFLLLFSVILFTPFLPDGKDYKEIGDLNGYEEEIFEEK